MRAESAKKRARRPARRKAVEAVKERDGVCQFFLRIVVWAQHEREDRIDWASGDGHAILEACMAEFDYPTPDCFGPTVGHEPVKRSHGADETNPDEIVLLCVGHNNWVEDYPDARKLLGL